MGVVLTRAFAGPGIAETSSPYIHPHHLFVRSALRGPHFTDKELRPRAQEPPSGAESGVLSCHFS